MAHRTRIMLVGALALLLTGVAIATAAWLVTGSGSGKGKAAGSVALVVQDATAPTGDLYPGYTAGKVALKVSNPNAFPVTVDSVALSAPTPSDCLVTVNSVNPFPVTGPTIAAGEFGTFTVDSALTMDLAAADSCQNQVITVTATVSGHSG